MKKDVNRPYRDAVQEVEKEKARLTFAGCFFTLLIIVVLAAILTMIIA